MTVSALLTQIYLAYRGKGSARVPAFGTDKSNDMLVIANRKKNEWATDPNNKWASLFENRLISVIDYTDTTYDLPDDFYQPSDFARIVDLNDSIYDYPIVKPQQRNNFSKSVYISGRQPNKIATFAQEINSSLDGGSLYIPGYYIPVDMALEADIVSVDYPEWLVYIVASELSRNDPAKDDQYVNLVNQANDVYRKMVEANSSVGFMQPNKIMSNMGSIGDAYSEDWLN